MPLSAPAGFAADTPTGSLQSLLDCRSITADAARLKCFDAAAAVAARTVSDTHVATRSPASSAAVATGTAGQKAAAFDPQRTFGLSPAAILAREVNAGVRRKAISHISARVTRLQQAPDGRMLYWLANGQVWEELEANGDAPPLRTGQSVRISRGWLGSYWLQAPSGRGCKVQRVH